MARFTIRYSRAAVMIDREVLARLIASRCNAARESLPQIRRRLYDTLRRGTYLVRYDGAGQLVGYADYDIRHGTIVHVRKLIALAPGVMRKLVTTLKTTLPWTRMFCYRAKYRRWSHHRRVVSCRG